MGGGDLNMKKSWHPQTMQNMERVWKAEAKAKAEQEKINQLLKEKAEERMQEDILQTAIDAGIKKKSDKMDWMYQGALGGADREEYLLGKAVDRSVLPKGKADDAFAVASQPGANFLSDEAANDPRDVARKVRSDPMFAIKKREQESIRELQANPVRMMALKKELLAMTGKKDSKPGDRDGKDRDKDSKHKKHRRSRSRSPVKSSRRSRSRSPARSPSPARRRSRSRSPVKGSSRRSRSPIKGSSRRSRSRSPVKSSSRRSRSPVKSSSRRSRSPVKSSSRRSRSPVKSSSRRSRSPVKSSSRRSRSRSPVRRRSPSGSPPRRRSRSPAAMVPLRAARRSPPKWKRKQQAPEETEAERQAKLAAMMADADSFARERVQRVEAHREETAREETQQKGAEFLGGILKDSFGTAAEGSMQDRIRRNVHYLQRTADSGVDGFLRKT